MKRPQQEQIIINGPVGRLEALLETAQDQGTYSAVICHPHPQYGGTMQNKVVHYAAKALMSMGMPVLRFNYRGVGQSEGEYDQARGEGDDLQACVEWMQQRFPQRKLVLAGFSFGSYVAASWANRLQASILISIAPPVESMDFKQIEPPACDWLVIQGSDDEVVSSAAVRQWVEKTSDIDKLAWMDGASHFFHGRLIELADHIKAWLQPMMKK